MLKCPRCNYSFAKDTAECFKCGYNPLKPSVAKIKDGSASKRKILVGAGVILVVIVVGVYVGFGT